MAYDGDNGHMPWLWDMVNGYIMVLYLDYVRCPEHETGLSNILWWSCDVVIGDMMFICHVTYNGHVTWSFDMPMGLW